MTDRTLTHHREHVDPHPRPGTLSPEDRLRLLGDVGRTLSTILDPQELFERVTELITHRFDYYYSIVMICENDELVIRSATVRDQGELSEMVGRRFRVGEHGITGWCAEESRTIVVPDVSREPHFVTHEGTERVRSAVAVPLLGRDRLIGVLDAESDRPDDFHADDVVLLETLAAQLAIVIENAELMQAERERARRLATVTEIARNVSSILDLQALLDQTTALIAERLGYYSVTILLVDQHDEQSLVWASGNPGVPHAPPSWRQRVGEGMVGWAVATGQTQLARDTLADPHFIQGPGLRTRSELDAPLTVGGRVLGVLVIGSEEPNAFADEDVPFVETLADQIAVAIENARLLERARELATSEERNRLAREIHDTLAQSITAMVLELDGAQKLGHGDPTALAGVLDHVRGLAHRALEEARHAIWSLQPVTLDRLPLAEAIGGEVMSLQRGSVEEAAFSIRGEERGLPAEAEAALFRIAQEAVSNIRKHAGARRARAILAFDERSTTLVIEDDGVGFESGAPPTTLDGGIGLASMRQRAGLVGAELEIDTSPGWGTRIRVVVPERSAADQSVDAGSPIRVLLVDDHAMVREGVRRMLETMPGIVLVGEAETAEQALARVRDLAPQVVLMDVHLPDMDGVEATRRIRADLPSANVLMLSTTAPDDVVLEAVRADARGYLLKDAGAEELRNAIQRAAEGGSYFSPSVAAKLAGGVRRGGPAVERLTARELAVLRHLANGAANKEIAGRLKISANTVQSHLRHIYGKLDVRSRTEALRRASEWGILEI